MTSTTTLCFASLLFLSLAAACDKQDATPAGVTKPTAGATAVDFTSPTKVTQAVFAAAASGDLGPLATLCDPKGDGDGDTRHLCTMTEQNPRFDEFKTFFTKGTTTSESIQGDEAEVGILFGPDGKKPETMKLVRRDGRWYLSSF